MEERIKRLNRYIIGWVRYFRLASMKTHCERFDQWIRRRLRIRADRKVLQAMPDYLLSDLGISRSQIDSATQFGRDYPLGPSCRL